MANRRINVTPLEFDQIKENLKEYLRGQEQFSDYDFEGSNLAVLLDVLAYNTHYNAMYMNMALNEAFLDSASKRASVVSLARGLGYTPRSASSARVKVNFQVVPGPGTPEPFVSIPRFTPFNGATDGERFTFYTIEDHTTEYDSDSNRYYFNDIELVEGTHITNKLAYTEDNRYLIPNPNVDLSTLEVKVQETSSSVVYDTFTLADFEATIDETSEVYFVREVDGGYHELYFGDGVLGRSLEPGNVVNVTYQVSSGLAANNIKTLSYGGSNINGGSVSSIVLQTPTAGGRPPESTEQVRFNAPNMYAAQNRAVTAKDYEAIILNKAPSIASVMVWGGENSDPPEYGKVFISATTKSGIPLTLVEQQDIITTAVNPFKLVSVIPEFKNPENLRIELDVVVYYDPSETSKSPSDIDTTVTQLLLAYNNTDLSSFNKIFRSSVVARVIDSADSSVISSVIRTKIRREVDVVYGKETNYTININNPIDPGSLTSSQFFKVLGQPAYLYDDEEGVVRHYYLANNQRVELGAIGSVDYSKGVVTLDALNIISVGATRFEIVANNTSPDIAGLFNQVVTIDPQRLKVTVVADSTTKGRSNSGNNFLFTPGKI